MRKKRITLEQLGTDEWAIAFYVDQEMIWCGTVNGKEKLLEMVKRHIDLSDGLNWPNVENQKSE